MSTQNEKPESLKQSQRINFDTVVARSDDGEARVERPIETSLWNVVEDSFDDERVELTGVASFSVTFVFFDYFGAIEPAVLKGSQNELIDISSIGLEGDLVNKLLKVLRS